ncbi:MAG TPA: RDD family protein [Marmoricola sp.]|nr:RDD family protein [Marmoricola sp.]
MSNVPAGWYADPAVPNQQRYWNGAAWTEHIAPTLAQAPVAPPMAYGAPQFPAPIGMPVAGVSYAHWGKRVGGALIDAVLTWVVLIVGIVVWKVIQSNNPAAWGPVDHVDYSTGTAYYTVGGLGILVIIVCLLPGFAFALWNQVFKQGRTGQTIGKKAVNITLLKEGAGQPLGPGVTFGRQLLHVLDSMSFYLGWLWPLWDAKRQTFADKIVGSVVVNTNGN